MGREEATRRLALVAGSLLAAAVASLPFAGGLGDHSVEVATVPGRPSTATVTRPAAGLPPVIEPATYAMSPAALVSPPPMADGSVPLPPPPPPPTTLDPSLGVVNGNGEAVPVPVPVPGRPPPSAVPDDAPGQRVWAVVVGIDDYPGTRSDLRAATADASDLVTALVQHGVPADHIRPLYDGAASVDGVLDAVDWLIANAGPHDTAVFLYAGHVRDLGYGTEAIVTAENGWIADWYLADRFVGLTARDAWFVVAGCYGGGFDELLGPSRVLTAAAGPGELAYENDGYGRSYLAEFVLRRALVERAAGEPTVQAAVAWASEQLAQRHPEHQVWNQDQAGHLISIDGLRRDGSAQPGTTTTQPPPAPPPDAGLLDGGCLLGLVGNCRDD